MVACLLILASRSSLHIRCVALHKSLSFCLASSRVVPRRQRQLSSRSSCLFLALCRSWFAAFAPVASWGHPSFVESPRCSFRRVDFVGPSVVSHRSPVTCMMSFAVFVRALFWSRRSWSLRIARRLVASPSTLLVFRAFCLGFFSFFHVCIYGSVSHLLSFVLSVMPQRPLE